MRFNIDNTLASEMFHLYALVLEVIKGKSIFYYNPGGLECNWKWFQQHNLTSQPQWVWRSSIPYIQLKEQHNSELFVLACISEDYLKDELKGLSASLIHLRNVKVLIELTGCERLFLRFKESMATDILLHFQQRNMLNVALYFQSRTNPLMLYSYEAFPQFRLLQRDFTKLEGVTLYPNQIDNLRGYTLRVITELSEPNTIIYTDARGQTFNRGFMWDFIATFAEKIGAKLKAIRPTWSHGRHLGELYSLELTKNGSVDIGLYTSQMKKKYVNRFHQYSYPIFYASWCIMIPLERPIEVHGIFRHILQTDVLALLMIALSCSCLSARLGGFRISMWNRYCKLFSRLLALFFVCFCQAQLLFLMILYPRQVPIDSFEALLASNLRICAMESDFYLLDGEFRARYAAAFRLINNVTELFQLRNSFNTSFAYSIPSNKWTVMETQQRNFQRSVFRYSELCLHGTIPYSIFLDEDSLYYEAIKFFSLKIHEAGLFEYWLRYSFYDMVKADRMKFKDYSTSIQPRPLRLPDFQIPCHYFGFGILLALILFTVELIWFYIDTL